MKLAKHLLIALLCLKLFAATSGVAFAVEPDFKPYLSDVLEKIKANWHPPEHHETVIVQFRIDRDGRLVMLHVTQNSKNANDDTAATQAIEAVTALPSPTALPKGGPEYLDVEVRFGIKKCWIERIGKKLADVDFGPYMSALQRKIRSNWFPPKAYESRRVSVVFKVANSGQVSGIKIHTSAGVPSADEAAIQAVVTSSPLEPLPEGSPKDVDIQFTFDYNVFSKNYPGHWIPSSSSPNNHYMQTTIENNMAKPVWDKVQLNWDECMNVGRKSLDAGDYDSARRLFQRAMELAQDEKPQSVHLAKSLNALADLSVKLGRASEAIDFLNRSMDVLQKSVGGTHPEIANDFEKLASIQMNSDTTDAEYSLKRCLDIRQKSLGAKSLPVANTQYQLAHMYIVLKRFSEAQPLLMQSLAIMDKTPGCADSERVTVLRDIVVNLKAMNQTKKLAPIEARLNELTKSNSYKD